MKRVQQTQASTFEVCALMSLFPQDLEANRIISPSSYRSDFDDVPAMAVCFGRQ